MGLLRTVYQVSIPERVNEALLRQHRPEQPLQGHDVAARVVNREKVALTMPITLVESQMVHFIVPGEGDLKAQETHALWLFRVAAGLLDLADKP
jgi:hypothetical protein